MTYGGKLTISYIYRAEPEEIDTTEAHSLIQTGNLLDLLF